METNLPVVTVLLPTYNCENYVHDSIQSILDQTFTDFDLLVIDDASTDRTVQVIEEFKDPRIRLIQKQKNSGYTDSLNQGIALARGRYIARMDADDISLPGRFEKQVNFLASHNDVAVCGTWYMEIPNNHIARLPTEHEDIKVAMLENNQLCHPSVMFKKDFFAAHHLSYNRDFESAEDYELWTRLIAIGKLGNLPEVLLHYRMHEQQVSTKHVYTQYARALICRKKMLLYLLDDCSAEEENVLDKILAAERIRSGPEFEKALAVFNRLVQQNALKGFYKKAGFLAFIDAEKKQVARNFFIFNERYDLSLLQRFYRFREGRNYLTSNEKMRLTMKCLLPWNAKRKPTL